MWTKFPSTGGRAVAHAVTIPASRLTASSFDQPIGRCGSLDFRLFFAGLTVAITATSHQEAMTPVVSVTPRLPTRCPACKGAVIQRMARAHASIWFHCFFCNHNWRFRLEDVRAAPDGELTGDVFVATSRRKRHSLGLVVLNAIPEDLLKQHLEQRTAQGELESRKLQREIDVMAARLEQARAEEDRLWKIQEQDKENLRKANAWSVAYNGTKIITRQLDDLRARRGQLVSGEYFFQDLPYAISSAKTQSDGKFALAIPRAGRYGIVARAACDQGEEKQTYFWFVWVSLDGRASKRLVLNDDNIVGAGSPDSALR